MSKIIAIMLLLCCGMMLFGCADDNGRRKAEQQKTIVVTDSVGRKVELPYPLERVAVCNVYNAELITAVGAIDKIVGVDNYIFKDQSGFKNRFNEAQVFGISQNAMNYEKLAELAPQAVIITGEGTWRDAQEMLDRFGIKVIVINSYYTDQFADNCRLIGRIFGREEQAEELVNYFNDKLAYIQKQLQGVPRRSLYFEYRTLGKTAVPGDYFYKMVEYSGADNIFAAAKGSQVDQEAIIEKDPQYIVKVADANAYSSQEKVYSHLIETLDKAISIITPLVETNPVRRNWLVRSILQNFYILNICQSCILKKFLKLGWKNISSFTISRGMPIRSYIRRLK